MSHIIYGLLTLVNPFYEEEFTRYGFPDYRIFVGITQSVAGGFLLLGFKSSTFTRYSAAYLAGMMAVGFITRLVIRDGLLLSSPAFVYMVVNSLIFIRSLITKK
ncbi:MAG: hypothetical protein ACON42_05555 [Flavobacteriaceae bacterium]